MGEKVGKQGLGEGVGDMQDGVRGKGVISNIGE